MLILQSNYIWIRVNIIDIRYWNSVAFNIIYPTGTSSDFLLIKLDAKSAKHNECRSSGRSSYLSIILDANTFVSPGCIFLKLIVIFCILLLFFKTQRNIKNIYLCLIGRDNTLLIASCVETSCLVKNMLPIECIFPLTYLP